MSTITIEIKDLKDRNLLLHLVERLGLKVVKEDVKPETDLEYHKKIIDAGTNISQEQMEQWLKEIDDGNGCEKSN